MTDLEPTDPKRRPNPVDPDLDASEIVASREARKAAANQDSSATNNPAQKSAAPATGGDGAAGAGGPKGFGTGS